MATCFRLGGPRYVYRSLMLRRRTLSSLSRTEKPLATPDDRPRWSYTPEASKAPFSLRSRDPHAFVPNESPAKLAAMYNKLFGIGGERILSEETRWLAITHKSFDQGRRGFNDRLAFFGRRILFLRSSLALLGEQRRATKVDDPWGRETFQHPSLEGLPNLASIDINKALGKERLSSLAVSCGIDQVARWNPRYPLDLKASGCEIVYASCLCAIVGAISLERGGQYVNKVVSGAILQPLGIERS